MLPLYAEQARKRMHQGRPPSGKEPPTSREEVTKGEAVVLAAKVVGVGSTTVHKAARIKREHPDRIKEIKDGQKTIR